MKANAKITILLFCISISLVSCKKWVIDYRNKYVGDYSFNWTELRWDWNNSVYVTSTVQTSGKIYYRPFHNFGRTITIEISDGLIFKPEIERNGVLKQDHDGTVSGNISGSEITFNAFIPAGGKAPGVSYTVTGVRK